MTEFSTATIAPADRDIVALLERGGTRTVAVATAIGRFRYVSPSIEATADQSVESFVLNGGLDVHSDDRADHDAAWNDIAAGALFRSVELRVADRNGGHRRLRVDLSNQLDARLGGIVAEMYRADTLVVETVPDGTTGDSPVQAATHLEAMLRATGAALCTVARDRTVTWSSPGLQRVVTGALTKLDRTSLRSWFDQGGAAVVDAEVNRLLISASGEASTTLARSKATGRWCEVSIHHVGDDASLDGVIVAIADVNTRVESALAGQRFTEVLEATSDLVGLFDPRGDLLWANQAALDVMNSNGIRRDITEAVPTWVLETVHETILPTVRETDSWRGELALFVGEAEVSHDVTFVAHRGPDGSISFVSTIARDMSDHKAMENRLHDQTRRDALTGLPNRTRLVESLTASLSRGSDVAVIFCDLDQFKDVNDTRGHDVGDRLLLAVARRLRGALRADDIVARFGGDEFVVVLDGLSDIDLAETQAQRVLDHAHGTTRVGELEVFVTLSAGIALATKDDDATSIIAKADSAMYEAKRLGRDRVEVYSDRLREATATRLLVARELRRAIDNNELDIWFQPIVDARTGQPNALEALARWDHPERGVVGPDDFVEIAEDTGLIVPLGSTLFRKAVHDMAAMGSAVEGLTLTVNISARQLSEPGLADQLAHTATTGGVDPGLIYCEITESAAMADVEATGETLALLRDHGFRIAIDDFGTGYSSLAYLQRFTVDLLKIDRSFIAALDGSEQSASLVAGIISLAHSLGIRVAAEGVETKSQLELLSDLGCDLLQGFLLARPAPPEHLDDAIRSIRNGDWR